MLDTFHRNKKYNIPVFDFLCHHRNGSIGQETFFFQNQPVVLFAL